MINVTINGKELLAVVDNKGNVLLIVENGQKKRVFIKYNNQYVLSSGNVKIKDLEMLVNSGHVKIK